MNIQELYDSATKEYESLLLNYNPKYDGWIGEIRQKHIELTRKDIEFGFQKNWKPLIHAAIKNARHLMK